MSDRNAHEPVTSPVTREASETSDGPEEGVALCLSGGGYRAMLFHVGALWRLNELGYLEKLDRLSSVSGGSITAATLGKNWGSLGFTSGVARRFRKSLVDPVRRLASKTIDADAIVGGLLLSGSISDKIVAAYDKVLFERATLQDLPDRPRFVINATNVQSGALWRFSKPYMRDWRVGCVNNPSVRLAVAVAASSAFPPVLSPLKLEVDVDDYEPASPGEDLHREPFLSEVVLTDGGVYDNLGLETAWKRYTTVLVSDGGGKMEAEEEPKRDWARHALRINALIDNQVRSLRKRQLIESFEREERRGAYWGIRTDIRNYGLDTSLDCPLDATRRLAETKTRLKRLDDQKQERLINWGYAVCDAAMRRHVGEEFEPPRAFPFDGVGLRG